MECLYSKLILSNMIFGLMIVGWLMIVGQGPNTSAHINFLTSDHHRIQKRLKALTLILGSESVWIGQNCLYDS